MGAAGVYAAYNAFFSINIRKLIDTGNEVLTNVNGTLNGAVRAANVGLPNAISETVSEIKSLIINPSKEICVSIEGINDILEDVRSKVQDLEDNELPKFDTLHDDVAVILNDINNKIVYDPQGKSNQISGVQFDVSGILSKIGIAYGVINQTKIKISGQIDDCSISISQVEDEFTNPNNKYFTSAVVTAQNSIIQTINQFSSTLQQIGLEQVSLYVSYVNIADSVRLAVELVIVAAPLLFFFAVTIGICANKKFLFKAPACCIFITFWLFFIISSLHIAFWIITKDICKEIPARQDTFLSLVGNLTGNPLAQFNTTIPAAAKGVLNCKSDFITETLGGSEKSITTIRSIIGIDSSFSSSISSMTSQISISKTISVGGDVSTSLSLSMDYNAMTSTLYADMDKFKNGLTDIKTDAESKFNSSLATAHASNPSLNRSSIQTYCATHNTTDVCKKYQNYVTATNQMTVIFADLAKVDAKLVELKNLIDVINSIVANDIKTAPQQITDKANEILGSVTTLVAKINNKALTLVDTVITKIMTVFTTPLSCQFIPSAINKVDEQFCRGIVLDSIVIGVSSFVIGVLCAIGFIFILLIDKYRTYQLKVQNKGKNKTPKSEKKKPVDLLHQIELTEDRDSERAKGAAPALEDLSPPTYEEASGNFFY